MAAGMRPQIDPEAGAVLAQFGPGFSEPVQLAAIPAERAARKSRRLTDDELRRDGAIVFEELTVPGPAGAPDISVLVCRPPARRAAAPGVVYFHGGGMIVGDNRTAISVMLDWIERAGVIVVSVEYRLAPEHPHPAPVEDCYAGLAWTATHAAELGIDPGRLLIAGYSSGGGLGAAVALMARDRAGPYLAGQLLACPMLDDRHQTPSSREIAPDGLSAAGWPALLGPAVGGPDVSAYAAPARETSLSGLPPAYLDVGSADSFRDETVDYATRIWRAGGAAELHVWPGGFHGFELMAPDAAISIQTREARIAWLHRILARG
jgi:acetyl esterase/lipase